MTGAPSRIAEPQGEEIRKGTQAIGASHFCWAVEETMARQRERFSLALSGPFIFSRSLPVGILNRPDNLHEKRSNMTLAVLRVR
jgi:hypothetical protein